MNHALVGETRLPRDFGRYTREFSLLELSCEPGSIPGKGRLEACARQAPSGFVFSLVLPSAIAALEPSPEVERLWKLAEGTARVLNPGWWVIRTPAAVRPTRRSRERLGEVVARLSQFQARVAWEPGGVWDPADGAETAEQLGAVLVQDVAREMPLPAPVLYARLLALGRGARIGFGQADRVAERALGFEEAVIVVEGSGARQVAKSLRFTQKQADEDTELEGLELEPLDAEAEEADWDDSEDDAIPAVEPEVEES